MQTVTVNEALQQLPALMNAAIRGEEVVITSEQNESVKLVPLSVTALPPRKAGSGKGTFFMADDFDAPLEDFREYME
jgi:antitoxin (DNA-binding transcriptional repressor) of toxin-antitoxin stability system